MVSGTCIELRLKTCQDHSAFSSCLSHRTTLLVRKEKLRMYPIDYYQPINPSLKRSCLSARPSLVGTMPAFFLRRGGGDGCQQKKPLACSRGRQGKAWSVSESGSMGSWLCLSASSILWFPGGLGKDSHSQREQRMRPVCMGLGLSIL